ncbi:MAG: glycogen/starch synthase, partial [bacterium]|nr:glycogen/starch synthase [bacterium]
MNKTFLKVPAFFKAGKIKILFVTTEAAPFAIVGGLGRVMYSLPKALLEKGYDCRLFLPKYATSIISECVLTKEIERLEVAKKDPHGLFVCNVLRCEREKEPVVYFLENQEYYEKRANVYGYVDDSVRWVLLSKGVLEFIRKSDWRPDVIVASDWQTGFVTNLLATDYKDDAVLSRIAAVFSIHNLHYQGTFDHRFISEMDFDAGQAPVPDFDDPRINKLNGMRRGIMNADVITTVSPTYSREILQPEHGEGLDELLKERRARLFGALNGIDYDLFNPATDTHIKANYSVSNFMKAKPENKLALQKQFGLKEDKDAFLIGIVSRMDQQKGFDLIMEISDQLFQNLDFQLVVVGEGDNKYRLFFQSLEKKYSQRIGGHYFFDPVLPRMIFAGADAILVPSLFEP